MLKVQLTIEHGESTPVTKESPESLYNTSQGYRVYLEDFIVIQQYGGVIHSLTHLSVLLLI